MYPDDSKWIPNDFFVDFLNREKGGNIFETLPSYELIKIRRSMFCFVLAFHKTIVPELSAYSLDVFWDLHNAD